MSVLAAPEVVYRDAHFLVLLKPPSLPTTAPDGGPCLFDLARALDPTAEALHPLSRLDLLVSGLVPFARTRAANAAVLAARRAGTLRRRYLGLTAGAPATERGLWDVAIGLDGRDPRKRRALPGGARGPGAKEARTRFALAERAGPLCALHLWPETGRTHQLRVHTAYAGVPLFGDAAYGAPKRLVLDNGRVLSAARVMLHCAAVVLPHPARPLEPLSLAVPAHPDLAALWQKAGGSAQRMAARPLAEDEET